MSFAAVTEKLVNDLIQAEYKNACEKFGEKYNSLHEGYAVLLEELEEVKPEITQLLNSIVILFTEDINKIVSYSRPTMAHILEKHNKFKTVQVLKNGTKKQILEVEDE